MTKNVFIIFAVFFIAAGAIAAGVYFLYPYNPGQPPRANETGRTKEGIKEVINANNQFALELYSELAQSGQNNIFYSPYSIFTALAMTYEGAKGKTAQEIKSVFHFPENNILEPNFAKIYNDLNKPNKDYALTTGNALWVQKNFGLLKDYTQRVEEYYGGKATNLDFVNETEKSRQIINSFIEEQTNNKIVNLIPTGFLDALTRLVLTNAIYFKGEWVWQFDKNNTKEMEFHISPTKVVKTPIMYMDPKKAKFKYADLEKLQILELPYKGDQISMLILLPKQGGKYDPKTGESINYNYTLQDIEKDLTIEKLKEWKKQLKETKLGSVYLPKFEIKTKYFLNKDLKALGMPTAFSSEADFSGMTGRRDLFIDFVIHQAYVKVDEKGTEAAAATAVGMKWTAVAPRNIFRADHPFIFIIQQKDTGNILFLGRVIDPSKL